MRTVPIHESLLRPQLLAGGERELVILNVVIAAGLMFGVGGLVGFITGLSIGAVVQFMLVLAAKKDTQALQVYQNFLHQQRAYPASSTLFALPVRNH